MRDGGNDRIVDTHTRTTTVVTREREERELRERAKSESRERMNTVSLQSFQHEKAIICCKEEEINGVCLIGRRGRPRQSIRAR